MNISNLYGISSKNVRTVIIDDVPSEVISAEGIYELAKASGTAKGRHLAQRIEATMDKLAIHGPVAHSHLLSRAVMTVLEEGIRLVPVEARA